MVSSSDMGCRGGTVVPAVWQDRREAYPTRRRYGVAPLVLLLLLLWPSEVVLGETPKRPTFWELVPSPPSETMPVPLDMQMLLILKILTFDRNFEDRAQSELKIGIAYVPDDPASLKVKDDLASVFESLSGKTVKKIPVTYSSIAYNPASGAVQADGISVLYIAPGNAAHLDRIVKACNAAKIITATGVPEYVDKGIAIGIGVRQDKPQILINLGSSKTVGTEFDASLLRISKVVR